jgi:phospholipase/carboxylesterase
MLDCLEHTPGAGATSSVIWMHGLGASGGDFVPVVPHLGTTRTRFVFPHAPIRPVTVNGGMEMRAWYDIVSMERGPDREPEADVRAAHADVQALIARENERGIPTERIVLAGFSQGAAMALFTGLRHPERFAGLLVLSGYLVVEDALDAERHDANADTPLMMMHGTEDAVVPCALGEHAYARVKDGRDASWRDYRMGHELCGPQVRDIRSYLERVLPA